MANGWKYFILDEFKCKCGCEENLINIGFVNLLDAIRTLYGKPMVITSGYRCPDYDKAIGGKGNHSLGLASDILVNKGIDMKKFVKTCVSLGIPRVILYKDKPHVHIDIVKSKPEGIFIL